MIARLGIRGALAAYALLLAVSAAQPAAAQDLNAPKWNPWVEFGGLGRDGDSRALIELWTPLMQGPTALFFFDGRFQFIEDDAHEGNAQFGLRKMTPSGWNLGAWVSGDVSETSLDNTFWQVSGGLEALSVKWDLRVNGYLPVTDAKLSPSAAEIILRRNNIFMIGGEEVALYGVDGEIGYLLFGSPETRQGTRHEFRVYGGGFWFDHSDAIDEVAGPSARIEWRIDDLIPDWGGSRFTLDAGYSHDEVRDDVWEVGARLRIPLGGAKTYAQLNPQARRMQERIERDHDIVTAKSGPEQVRDALTGVRFDRVAYVNPSITDVSAQAGNNSLLIVNGTITGPQELQGNQTLQGGKSTILVTGLKSGVTTGFTAPGPRARLVDPEDNPNLTLLGSNTHVAGLNVQGAGMASGLFDNDGIFGDSGLSNIVVEQTRIADTGGHGITFNEVNSNVRIFDTAIANTGAHGIFFDTLNRNVTIANTTVTNSDGDGIDFGQDNRNVTIASTVIANAGGDGIFFGSLSRNVTILNTVITDADNNGINFSSGHRNVTIANSTITNAGTDGIDFGDSNRNVTIDRTFINGAEGAGIDFGSSNNNVTIAGTTIENATGRGIEFDDFNQNVTIAGTTIRNVDDGIFMSINNTVTLIDSVIRDTGDDGIVMDSVNTVTLINSVIRDAVQEGIDMEDNNTVTLINSVIRDVDDVGIIMFGNNTVTLIDSVIRDVGNDGIFMSTNNMVTIIDSVIRDAVSDGIAMDSVNTVTLIDSVIRDVGNDGIFMEDNNMVTIIDSVIRDAEDGIVMLGNNTVTLTNSVIRDTEDVGIIVVNMNTVTLTNSVIRNASTGLFIAGSGNEVTMNDSALAGTFLVDGIDVPNAGNTFAGEGNTAAGATFGGVFCNVTGAQTGSIFFVDRGVPNPTPGTCPPGP